MLIVEVSNLADSVASSQSNSEISLSRQEEIFILPPVSNDEITLTIWGLSNGVVGRSEDDDHKLPDAI